MKAAASIIRAPLKMIGLIPKTPKAPTPSKPVTMDEARDAASAEDELRRRKGGGADMLTGARGAEAGTTGKVKLG